MNEAGIPPKKRKDLIIVAAACLNDEGQVFALPAPNRHHNVIQKFKIRPGPDQQGFLLCDGRFIMRKAAKVLAEANGQYLTDEAFEAKHGKHNRYKGPELFSEDLW